MAQLPTIPVDANKNRGSVILGHDGSAYNVGDVDDEGRQKSRTYIWDSDSLSWVASTGELTGSQVPFDPLAGYRIASLDSESDPKYFGYLGVDGAWYIMKLTSTAATYCKGDSGFSTAWTNRASQTYNTFDQIF